MNTQTFNILFTQNNHVESISFEPTSPLGKLKIPDELTCEKGRQRLPQIVLITGKNGIGKTYLLDAIMENNRNMPIRTYENIECGIHYTRHKGICRFIFQRAKKFNEQYFITTHSIEFIQAFNAIQFRYTDIDSGLLELFLNKKRNTIGGGIIEREQLRYCLSHKGRVRGE